MEPLIPAVLAGLCLALVLVLLWSRARGTKARREAADLSRQIETLRAEEAQRTEEAERRRRFFEENDVGNSDNQRRFVGGAELRAVRPVNREAFEVLKAMEEWVEAYQPDWRLSFEVAMGAFVRTRFDPRDRRTKSAFSSYNSKRVDFLLIDRKGWPALVVEYHGTGHDLSGDASDRMDVKRLALARAGIPLAEIPAGAGKAEIFRLVSQALAASSPRRSGSP